jgi:hypothetical protein
VAKPGGAYQKSGARECRKRREREVEGENKAKENA